MVKKRILFLQFIRGKSVSEIREAIQEKHFVDSSDCLLEGSTKDKITHFILRLICSSDTEMKTFFVLSEVELFKYRLEFCCMEDLRKIMVNTSNQIRQVLKHGYIISSYKKCLLTFLQITHDLDIAKKKHYDSLKVPFEYALIFVKNRIYPLISGKVHIPLNELKNILYLFCKELITQGILQLCSSACYSELKDPRLNYIMKEIKVWFKSNFTFPIMKNKVLTEENLDFESNLFPQCMKSMHGVLRKFHRLPHHARIKYILFLKEIGVPHQEVIKLFMKEYSHPVNNTNCCSHSWNENEKRYVYSIEHLYGKKGSGKNYKAHSCHSLQSCNSSSVYDGGCPFSGIEDDNISSKLYSEGIQVQDIEEIRKLSADGKYSEACYYNLIKKMSTAKLNFSRDTCNPNLLLDKEYTTSNIYEVSHKNMITNYFLIKKSFSTENFSLVSRPSDFYKILSNCDKS